MARHPFRASTWKAKQAFELVHSDLCGPIETPSVVTSDRYILTLTEHFTHYVWVYFLKTKDQAERSIRNWFAYVERQYEQKVMCLRTDRGGEFM